MWKRWWLIKSKANRQLAQTLDPFNDEMADVCRYERWNKKYCEDYGRRVYSFWVRHGLGKKVKTQLGKRDRKLVRRFGRALRRLKRRRRRE